MLWRGGLGIVRRGKARYGWGRFCYGKARRSRLGAVCCDKFRFGSVSQGTAVEARYDELRFVQAGRGQVSQGGQGKACWVELGHGGARRSRLGLFRYGRIWLGMMGRGGRGAVR